MFKACDSAGSFDMLWKRVPESKGIWVVRVQVTVDSGLRSEIVSSLASSVRLDLGQVFGGNFYEAMLGFEQGTEFDPGPSLCKWDPVEFSHIF